jgi:hypothetical protein
MFTSYYNFAVLLHSLTLTPNFPVIDPITLLTVICA